ncbi:MAG TPA: hypothetical protein VJH92_03545 [Candidatus Nanoarchaeia archaeon]|nr:hypothetical protein [Candidatus Nanoarchaeia archaeon]
MSGGTVNTSRVWKLIEGEEVETTSVYREMIRHRKENAENAKRPTEGILYKDYIKGKVMSVYNPDDFNGSFINVLDYETGEILDIDEKQLKPIRPQRSGLGKVLSSSTVSDILGNNKE